MTPNFLSKFESGVVIKVIKVIILIKVINVIKLNKNKSEKERVQWSERSQYDQQEQERKTEVYVDRDYTLWFLLWPICTTNTIVVEQNCSWASYPGELLPEHYY